MNGYVIYRCLYLFTYALSQPPPPNMCIKSYDTNRKQWKPYSMYLLMLNSTLARSLCIVQTSSRKNKRWMLFRTPTIHGWMEDRVVSHKNKWLEKRSMRTVFAPLCSSVNIQTWLLLELHCSLSRYETFSKLSKIYRTSFTLENIKLLIQCLNEQHDFYIYITTFSPLWKSISFLIVSNINGHCLFVWLQKWLFS